MSENAPATPLDDPRVLALVEAGKAVVDRWDSPLWKDLPHTGESIADLRAALSALKENELDEPLHRHTWNPPTNFGSKEQ